MSDMPRLLESPEFSSFCIFAPELGEPNRRRQTCTAPVVPGASEARLWQAAGVDGPDKPALRR